MRFMVGKVTRGFPVHAEISGPLRRDVPRQGGGARAHKPSPQALPGPATQICMEGWGKGISHTGFRVF